MKYVCDSQSISQKKTTTIQTTKKNNNNNEDNKNVLRCARRKKRASLRVCEIYYVEMRNMSKNSWTLFPFLGDIFFSYVFRKP